MLRKKYLASLAVAGIASLSIISSAHADGYEPEGKAFVAPSKIINWTGVYIGGQVGYGWADGDSAFDFGHPHVNHFLFDEIGLQKNFGQNSEGWMGGGHLGVQFQHGNWIFGAEGTYDKMDLDASSSADFNPTLVIHDFGDGSCPDGGIIGGCVVGTQSLKTEIDDLWTLTGRVGYAWGRWMAYIKGGYARAEVNAQSNIDAGLFICIDDCGPIAQVGFSGSSKEEHDGWVLGAGTAYMVHKNVTLGFDYSYIDLDSETHTVKGVKSIDFSKIDGGHDFGKKHGLEVDPDAIHAVSARLTFLFGPEERVIAPLK